jgi:hypothetical protein
MDHYKYICNRLARFGTCSGKFRHSGKDKIARMGSDAGNTPLYNDEQ